MKLLYALICYNRPHCMNDWIRAWRQSERENAKLYILSTGDIAEPSLPAGAKFLRVGNQGLDIGALQRFIVDPPEDYDLLMWGPDDFLPMRSDFLSLYRDPFADPKVGLVGTYWGDRHIRSGGVCLRREVAERLRFPAELMGGSWEERRHGCFKFEGLVNWQVNFEFNFWHQVKEMGYECRLSNGTTPPESPHWRTWPEMFILWDRGWSSNDLWNLFDLTFPEVP